MKILSFFIFTTAFITSFTRIHIVPQNQTYQIAKGIRAFIDDSLYTFDVDYTLLSTNIFPDSFSEIYPRGDTLYSVELAGIANLTNKLRVSVGFKHHDVTVGTYFHNYFSNDDTLCGITFSNKCYNYFMPNKLNPNYNVTIISIDSNSVKGTFVGQVDALWYDNPKDSATTCKGVFRPKEKFIIRGEFNVPIKRRIIIHKKYEQHD